jgi:GntR family transcriptional regulator
MDVEIKFNSRIPLYEQIAQQIVELINQRDLKPGDQLPTTRELARKLGVNFNTVARAYRVLNQDAIVSTQHGRGTFLMETNPQKTNQTRKTNAVEELARFYFRKASYLGFTPEEIKTCFENIFQEEMDQ